MPDPIFDYVPSYAPEEVVDAGVRKDSFGDGYEQTFATGINNQNKVWRLRFENVGTAEALAIQSFLAARDGHEHFAWTSPEGDEGAYLCRSWRKSQSGPETFTIDVEFERRYLELVSV